MRCRLAALCLLLSACSGDPASLDGPTQAIVARDGLVYVTDGYFHARIAVFTPEGRFVRAWGSKGFELGQMQTPHGIVQTPDETLLVADRDNGRLQWFTTSGAFVKSVRSDELGRPWSVAQLEDGTLFAADGGDQRPEAERAGIVQLDASGSIIQRFGHFGTGQGELDEPHMLAVSESAEVFVAELGTHRLQRFSPRADCDEAGQACDYEVSLDWPALDRPGLTPLSIAVDEDHVYVGHQGQPPSIWVLDRTTGNFQTTLAEGAFERPHGLFIAEDRTLWVADDYGDQVVHLAADGSVLGTLGKL
ncbi:MAG TPA: hypothetical protein VJV79_12160 [Polyangiaceae bacterium]|nr:hypothetical protein [Polyangiaceae bacterium]